MGSPNISITKIPRALETLISVSKKGPSISETPSVLILLIRTGTKQLIFSSQIRDRNWNSALWYTFRSLDLHKLLFLLHCINKFFSLMQLRSILIHIRCSDLHHVLTMLSISSLRWHKVHLSLQIESVVVGVCQNNHSCWLMLYWLPRTLKSTLCSQWLRSSSNQQ